jgi:hypothetical protein
MLLIPTFEELFVVAGRSLTQAGRSHAVSGRPMLIHNAMPCPCRARTTLCSGLERSLSERYGRGKAWARHGICESKTAVLCKSNGKDTFQTLCGTAWQENGMGTAWYV